MFGEEDFGGLFLPSGREICLEFPPLKRENLDNKFEFFYNSNLSSRGSINHLAFSKEFSDNDSSPNREQAISFFRESEELEFIVPVPDLSFQTLTREITGYYIRIIWGDKSVEDLFALLATKVLDRLNKNPNSPMWISTDKDHGYFHFTIDDKPTKYLTEELKNLDYW